MREISFCVFTTTSLDQDDGSPVKMVSAEVLTYYLRCEAVAAAVCAVLLAEVITVAIVLVCSSKIMVIG